MKKLATLLVTFCAIILLACNSRKAEDNTEKSEPTSKTLVLYYSQTDATKTVAEELQKALNADIEAIELEDPYPSTYDETIQRVQNERETGKLPSLKPLKSDLKAYDVILLGYPVWFGTYARPIEALVKAEDFDGKKIVTFSTFGSGGLETSTADLRAALPKAEVIEGYGVRNARLSAMPTELKRFLIKNGYIEGEFEELPDFSEQAPVTAEESKIFDEACGDYPYPLGTPVTVAKRNITDGTEYKFIVDSTDKDGNKTEGTVYVVTTPGAKAEFTRTVR